MSHRSRDELEKIVREKMPGYRLADAKPVADSWARRAAPEAHSPDIAALRRKFLGADAPSADTPETGAYDSGEDDEESNPDIVAVVPEQPADPWDRAARPKSVVIAPDGEIIGTQG